MIPPTQGAGALVLAVVALLGFGAFFYRAWKLYRYLRLGWNEDREHDLAGADRRRDHPSMSSAMMSFMISLVPS